MVNQTWKWLILAAACPIVAQAQILNQDQTKDANGQTVIQRSVGLTDPVTGETQAIQQTFLKNPDGTLSPKRGTESPSARRLHQDLCKSVGGTDVTDKSVLVLGSNTLDATVCNTPVGKSGAQTPAKAGVVSPLSSTLQAAPDSYTGVTPSTVNNGAVTSAAAPSGTVPLHQDFTVFGQYTYEFVGSPQYAASLVINQCSIGDSGYLSGGSGLSFGKKTLYITCYAASSGTYVSTLTACVAGNCKTAHGAITTR